MIGNGHAGFGRGALEKGRKAPRPRPTSAILDPAFGLGFIKICSYFPYPLKMWVNGHDWAKRQAAGQGLAFTELANGFANCEDPGRLQAICDRLSPAKLQAVFNYWITRIPCPFTRADH